MITQNMQNALNAHIQAEMFSSHLYQAMSAWCTSQNYAGFGRWLRVQSAEEHAHTLKMVDFVLDRGGKVEFKGVEAPPAEFGNIVQVFEAVLKHEVHVTALVHRVFEAARAEKDIATETFLQWFVSEQVQEEATASEIAGKLRMVGDRPGAALYLDKEYGKRQG
jgi:ferritin